MRRKVLGVLIAASFLSAGCEGSRSAGDGPGENPEGDAERFFLRDSPAGSDIVLEDDWHGIRGAPWLDPDHVLVVEQAPPLP